MGKFERLIQQVQNNLGVFKLPDGGKVRVFLQTYPSIVENSDEILLPAETIPEGKRTKLLLRWEGKRWVPVQSVEDDKPPTEETEEEKVVIRYRLENGQWKRVT